MSATPANVIQVTSRRCMLGAGPIAAVIAAVISLTGCDLDPTGVGPVDAPFPGTGSLSRLTVRGNRIVDAEGNQRILRGVAVIDPLLWRDYRFGARRMGESHFRTLSKDWDVDVIRVPIHPDLFAFDPEYLRKYVDPIVDWGREYGIYVFLGYHAHGNPLTLAVEDTPWGFEAPWHGNPYNPDRLLAISAMTAIASRYRDEDGVFYGSFNEPAFIPWHDWRPVAEELVDAVHEVNPDALVTVSGVNFASDLSGVIADPVERGNVVYEIHSYPWVSERWKTVVDELSQTHPVFVGEWGFGDEHPATAQGYAEPLLDYCKRRGLGWTAWVWDDQWTPRMFRTRAQEDLTEFGLIVRSALRESLARPTVAGIHLP